jgi:hypothetical protein
VVVTKRTPSFGKCLGSFVVCRINLRLLRTERPVGTFGDGVAAQSWPTINPYSHPRPRAVMAVTQRRRISALLMSLMPPKKSNDNDHGGEQTEQQQPDPLPSRSVYSHGPTPSGLQPARTGQRLCDERHASGVFHRVDCRDQCGISCGPDLGAGGLDGSGPLARLGGVETPKSANQ